MSTAEATSLGQIVVKRLFSGVGDTIWLGYVAIQQFAADARAIGFGELVEEEGCKFVVF